MNVFSTKSGKSLKESPLSFLAEQMYTLKQVNPADGDVYHSSANDALTQKKNTLQRKLPPVALANLPAIMES